LSVFPARRRKSPRRFYLKNFMSEKIIRTVATSQGNVKAIAAANARQTFVATPTAPAGQSATYGARVPAVIARNARASHVT
jgi:hypothetical protein